MSKCRKLRNLVLRVSDEACVNKGQHSKVNVVTAKVSARRVSDCKFLITTTSHMKCLFLEGGRQMKLETMC